MTEDQEVIASILKDALEIKKTDDLIYDINWEIPRTSDFPENDSRRLMIVEGISLLNAAIASAARTDSELSSFAEPSLPQGAERIKKFRDLIKQGHSYEQTIVEMRKLIEDRLQDRRKSWETTSITRLKNKQTVTPREGKLKWGAAVEDEYDWQLRLTGFELGLAALGVQIDSKEMLIPGVSIPKEKVLEIVNEFPDQGDFFIKTQFPRVKQLAKSDNSS